MKQPELGKPCDPMAERDAIHIAVYPIIAGEKLWPGQKVGINPVNREALSLMATIGVVDPFLPKPVEKGERVYILLCPGQITGLRHVYTHPLLDGKEAAIPRLEATEWKVKTVNGWTLTIAAASYEQAKAIALRDGYRVSEESNG